MQEKNGFLVLLLLLIAAAAVAYWFMQRPPGVTPMPEPPHEAAEESVTAPAVPLYPVPKLPAEERRKLQPLPPLSQSDAYLRIDIDQVLGSGIAEMLVTDALIERLVATIDNLPRQRVAGRIRPVKSLPGSFAVTGQDDSGQYLLDQANYQRYAGLVAQLAAADVGQIVELYRRYYPLFQAAYQGLGYPQGYFNDRLVEVLDHLLATPDIDGPILLVRPHVLYEFDDAQLEALSGGQKLLLRMGPENRAAVLSVLRQFREQVAFRD